MTDPTTMQREMYGENYDPDWADKPRRLYPSSRPIERHGASSPVSAGRVNSSPTPPRELTRQATMNPITPGSVASLDVSIQRGFRLKLFTILLVQQLSTIALVAALLNFAPLREPIFALVPRTISWEAIVLAGSVVAGLGVLALVRNHHPCNLLCLACWSVLLAVTTTAFSSRQGYMMLQLLGMCTAATAERHKSHRCVAFLQLSIHLLSDQEPISAPSVSTPER